MLAGQLLDVERNRLLTELRIDQIPCNTQNLRTGAAKLLPWKSTTPNTYMHGDAIGPTPTNGR